MSIAVCFVARTGIVMGTDSRVTTRGPKGETREDAYPKLVQFGRLPIGMAMVGVGAYGGLDFRALVAETYRAHCPARGASMDVEAVTRAFAATAGKIAREAGATAAMTVLVGGFSPGAAFGELWEVGLPEGEVALQAAQRSQTFVWRGHADAIQTLWWGANLGALRRVLSEHGVADPSDIMSDLKRACAWGPERIAWGMPLSAAVELVRFQLATQIEAERFLPGRGACGPPTQIVAINDSGLHWIDAPFATFAGVGCDPS